jgi:hypothetical protein
MTVSRRASAVRGFWASATADQTAEKSNDSQQPAR